ncbi:ras-associating and dilute domain-containing protein-like [Scleropages formosus]|uniref:Ras-associating and dilute domain-containing protein-like n=1 Tax=Scleropages formosus TaxID=113540 RepID=A0A0P7V7E0_SCLFO|nr:ras-associating and dilute domain-containing protein-like [Scleropages formosus]
MISEERNSLISKQVLTFPVGMIISSPKRRLAKLGRKPSSGSLQSSSSCLTTKSADSVSTSVRQPAKNKIRRHNNRLSTVFNRGPFLWDGGQGYAAVVGDDGSVEDDPSELSNHISTPGILKVFGNDICQGANYKSVLATSRSSAKELVKEAVERYCLDKAEASAYVLCDVIGVIGEDRQWKTEGSRVVGDNEKPLLLQSLWKPKEGYSRRFEIQRRASVEERNAREQDTVTAGINAQARKLQKIRSRVSTVFVDNASATEAGSSPGLWRSLSEMDLPAQGQDSWAHEAPSCNAPEPRANKEAYSPSTEKEETESSDDNATQYSIHPPFDFPYFLLLQGYSYRQDFVIYLMTGPSTIFGRCSEHSTGEDVERLNVDVPLAAPDVLPQHCCVRRVETPGGGAGGKTLTLLRPLGHALVVHNGIPLKAETELHPGDLVRLGEHYMFMFKDPTSEAASCLPPWLSRLSGTHSELTLCGMCGSSNAETKDSLPPAETVAPLLRGPDGQDLVLFYELEQEDRVLKDILGLVDPHGADPKLTPAFLLCLCIQHSAMHFEMSDMRCLLLRIASQVQMTMWERTKELAAIQPEMRTEELQQDTDEVPPLTIEELLPGLQLLNSDLSQSALEEATTVLEEVIMFTFQQSVYYLTKALYAALPAVLDSNPFSDHEGLRVPEGVGGVLAVLKSTLELLCSFQVHWDITTQLFAYLFFFINASLFNTLMERGSGGGFYKWSKGVQIRANLDLLMDWAQGAELGHLAVDFFQKLSAAVNLLATPKENLLQVLRNHIRFTFFVVFNTTAILESFDNHPPLVLPTDGFHLELGKLIRDARLCEQLARLQGSLLDSSPRGPPASPKQLLQSLLSKPEKEEQVAPPACVAPHQDSETPLYTPRDREEINLDSAAGPGIRESPTCSLSSHETVLTHKLKSLELQAALPRDVDLKFRKRSALDPTCLLTPPHTPQESAELESGQKEDTLCCITTSSQEDARLQTKGESCAAEEEEAGGDEEVFTVELQKGPSGLGLSLVDGMKTALKMKGIYIKSVVEDSPAAWCEKLSQGDRILAVNGVSLVGMDYNSGRDLIRTSGDELRLLVAKSELACKSWLNKR